MNTIFWMTDELFARAESNDWQAIEERSARLIGLIGRNDFAHTIISPDSCIGPLARSLAGRSFSAVIDLTDNGWLSRGLGSALNRDVRVITNVHISRVREISDPGLPTSGHIIRTPREDLVRLIDTVDLSKSLVLDDVSFSGKSSELVMQLLGLNPRQTSHGFLITNIGDLGPKTRGAWSRLTDLGSEIHTGSVINTTEGDDGWHIKDFVRQDRLDRALGLVPVIHELFRTAQDNGALLKHLFSLESTRSLLFPNAISGEELFGVDTSRFIRSDSFRREGMHTTNPNLLTSPAFLEHISTDSFARHIDEVSELLHSIQRMTNLPEGNTNAVEGMNRIVEREIHLTSKERSIV